MTAAVEIDRLDPQERARARVLIVEDDAAMRELVVEELSDMGYCVEAAPGGRAGVERIRQGGIDVVVSDLKMPDLDGFDLLRDVKAIEPSPHVVVITAFGSIDTAIKAVKLGACDYITKPLEIEALAIAVDKALAERGLRREIARLRREVARPYRFENIVGKSPAMQEVFQLVSRLSSSTASVLVTGDSGTGKELIARAIHYNSPRAKKPFLAVNLAAIPDTLIESELFGYKRGAFTDARTDRCGLFVEADQGTIFLDEIGELPPPLQAKLLRVLQEREVRPLGATRAEKIDVRVIAATNRDLEARMREGMFREDLYYRLNVIHIALPPLRSRPEDILALAEHFLAEVGKRSAKDRNFRAARFSQAATKAMLSYPWPGNVRELENVIERAVALCDGEEIGVDDLPSQVRERRSPDLLAGALARGLTLADLEREYIERVLAAEGGNKTRAANRLGLDRKTLYRKLEEYSKASSPSASYPSVLSPAPPTSTGQGTQASTSAHQGAGVSRTDEEER
ncbi:MAG: sigma-54-dependent Fis family transcriptional regulator [Deltaproteobacteria bacterium]|nr:sigma-54-dependent Fis family transcriptional regulator [Deltaproteobacteria bacterium]